MWAFLKKLCMCVSEPTNAGTTCDPSLKTTNDVVYNGENLTCIGIETGDTITVVLQKIDNFLCGEGLTQHIIAEIETNPEEYIEFITLINSVISCQTINSCGPVPTTTTTTTLLITTTTTTTIVEPTTTTTSSSTSTSTTSSSTSTTTSTSSSSTTSTTTEIPLTTTTTTSEALCTCYSLSSVAVPPPDPTVGFTNFEYIDCSGTPQSIGVMNDLTEDVCAQTGTVVEVSGDPGIITLSDSGCCITTTTTTTILCISGDLVIDNQSNTMTIEDVYAASWLTATSLPVGPNSSQTGAQNGTNNPISVDITSGEVGELKLYINCVLFQTLVVSVTDTYTFGAVTIDNLDSVTIVLS